MARLGAEAIAILHIPLHTPALLDRPKTHVDTRLVGFKVRFLGQVRLTVLSFNSVIGLAAIHPMAIDTDAHARR